MNTAKKYPASLAGLESEAPARRAHIVQWIRYNYPDWNDVVIDAIYMENKNQFLVAVSLEGTVSIYEKWY